MPQVHLYIRNEDIDKWAAIEHKAEFVHNALNPGDYDSGIGMKMYGDGRVSTMKGGKETPLNFKPITTREIIDGADEVKAEFVHNALNPPMLPTHLDTNKPPFKPLKTPKRQPSELTSILKPPKSG